jgi:hypothetical protein
MGICLPIHVTYVTTNKLASEENKSNVISYDEIQVKWITVTNIPLSLSVAGKSLLSNLVDTLRRRQRAMCKLQLTALFWNRY